MPRRFPRFLPTSMAAQLIVLLLAALVLSNAITTGLFVDGQRASLEAANNRLILQRTLSIIELVQSTPRSLHRSVLNAASDGTLRFTLTESPLVEQSSPERLFRRLSAIMANQLEGEFEVRIRNERPDDFKAWQEWRRDQREWREEQWRERRERWRREGLSQSFQEWRDERPPRERPPPPPPGDGPIISVSIGPIPEAGWLNVAAVLPKSAAWTWPLFASMALMALMILIIVAFFVRRIVRPMRDLALAADKYGRGEPIEPLAVRGPNEVARASSAFNAMEQRLTRFIQDRTRLLAAIGHDLRTPITSLRLRAEFIDDEENRQKIIETLDEMAAMTEATLRFARDDADQEAATEIDLAACLRDLVETQSDLGHTVSYSGLDQLAFVCRSTALKRSLRNLVENAVRYGEQARLHLSATPDDVVILVEDDGPGIEEDKIADVFEPFVRLEESRSQETGGVGLGLAIARSIVRAHGGELSLENRMAETGDRVGLTARVVLPR